MNVCVYVGVLAYILHDMFMCMWVCWPIFYIMCMWVCWPIFYMNVYVYVGVLAYILHECLCVCGCVGLYST